MQGKQQVPTPRGSRKRRSRETLDINCLESGEQGQQKRTLSPNPRAPGKGSPSPSPRPRRKGTPSPSPRTERSSRSPSPAQKAISADTLSSWKPYRIENTEQDRLVDPLAKSSSLKKKPSSVKRRKSNRSSSEAIDTSRGRRMGTPSPELTPRRKGTPSPSPRPRRKLTPSPRPGYSARSPSPIHKARGADSTQSNWKPYRIENIEEEIRLKDPKAKASSLKTKGSSVKNNRVKGKRSSTEVNPVSPGNRFRGSLSSARACVDSLNSLSDVTSKRSVAEPRRSDRGSTPGRSSYQIGKEWTPFRGVTEDYERMSDEEEPKKLCGLSQTVSFVKVIGQAFNIVTEFTLAFNVYWEKNKWFFGASISIIVFNVFLCWYIGCARSSSIPKEQWLQRILLRVPLLNMLTCVYMIPSTVLLFAAFSNYPAYLINISYVLEASHTGLNILPIQGIALIGSFWALVMAPYLSTSGSMVVKERKHAATPSLSLKKNISIKLRILALFLPTFGICIIVEIIHFVPLLVIHFLYNDVANMTFLVLLIGINIPKLLFLFYRVGDKMLYQTVSSPISAIYLIALFVISTPCAMMSLLLSNQRSWSEKRLERGLLSFYLLSVTGLFVYAIVVFSKERIYVLIPSFIFGGCALWLLVVTSYLGKWFRVRMTECQREISGEYADLSLFHFFCITGNIQMVDLLTLFGVQDTIHRGEGSDEDRLTGLTSSAKRGLVDIVRVILLNTNAEERLNAPDGKGYSAFHWSIFARGKPVVLDFLLTEHLSMLDLGPFKTPSWSFGGKKEDGTAVTPLEFCLKAQRYHDRGKMLYLNGINNFSLNKSGERRKKKYQTILTQWEEEEKQRILNEEQHLRGRRRRSSFFT